MSQAETDDLYQALIMERARSPRHAGRLVRSDGEAEGDNPMCGDRVHIGVRCDGGTIIGLKHETRGCAICIAAADLMGDAVIGRQESDIEDLAGSFEAMITSGDIPDRAELSDLRALSGVHDYRSRHRCALLPWQALRAALDRALESHHG